MRLHGVFLAACCFLLASTPEARAATPGIEVSAQYSLFSNASTGDTYGIQVALESSGIWLPAVGVKLDYQLARGLHFVPELLFVERGGKTKVSAPYASSHQTAKEQQLALLALIRPDAKPWGFLELGPEVTYLLSAKVSGTYSLGLSGPIDFDEDYTDQTGRWDLLIVGGAGTTWPVGGHAMTLEVRFAQGVVAKDRPGVYVAMFGNAIPWYTVPPPPFTTSTSRTRAVEIATSYMW